MWSFTADGQPCKIWDYKGSWRQREYRTFGPASVFMALFGTKWSPF